MRRDAQRPLRFSVKKLSNQWVARFENFVFGAKAVQFSLVQKSDVIGDACAALHVVGDDEKQA